MLRPYLAVILLSIPSFCQQVLPPAAFAQGKSATHDSAASIVNVVTDCGAVGDGVTDDWRVIQSCIDRHPGKAIFFPKMRDTPCIAGAGGGCSGSVDYFVSRTLKLSGNTQVLMGETPSRWPGGAVQIKFPRDLAGPGIWIPANVYSGALTNLFLNGQRCWNPTDLSTFDEPSTLTGIGPDGVLLTGGEPSIYGVTAYCFGRHGFAVLGDNSEGEPTTGQPDFWGIQNSFAYANRGYGLYISGGDSNAGESIALKTTGNQLGGIYDHSLLGNTHISPSSHMDNRNPIAAGTKYPIRTISVDQGVCKLSLDVGEKALTAKDTWITIGGTSGGESFNGTFRLMGVDSQPPEIVYACSATGGPATGGTVSLASSSDVYSAYHARGIPTGVYLGRGESSVSIWINPYCELNSNAPNFSNSSIVIGRACEGNVSGDRTWTSWAPGPGWGSTMRVGQGLNLDNASDTMNWLTIRAGRTKDQFKGLRLAGLQKDYWDIGQFNDTYFFIRDAQTKGFMPILLNKGGTTDVSAPNDSAVRLGRGSRGGIQFFGGNKEVADVDASGKATFNSVCISSNVCWEAGSGAPPPEACTRSKGGSLYTKTGESRGNLLYVCDGSTGTWVAK